MKNKYQTDEPQHQFTTSPEEWAKLKPRARDMRHTPTPAEAALWQRLRSRRIGGAKFRRQHVIAGFIVDFVCIEYRLVIEVDGVVHEQDDQRQYDAQRQAALEARGFRVLRFTNGDVLQALNAVAQVIGETLADIQSSASLTSP